MSAQSLSKSILGSLDQRSTNTPAVVAGRPKGRNSATAWPSPSNQKAFASGAAMH